MIECDVACVPSAVGEQRADPRCESAGGQFLCACALEAGCQEFVYVFSVNEQRRVCELPVVLGIRVRQRRSLELLCMRGEGETAKCYIEDPHN